MFSANFRSKCKYVLSCALHFLLLVWPRPRAASATSLRNSSINWTGRGLSIEGLASDKNRNHSGGWITSNPGTFGKPSSRSKRSAILVASVYSAFSNAKNAALLADCLRTAYVWANSCPESEHTYSLNSLIKLIAPSASLAAKRGASSDFLPDNFKCFARRRSCISTTESFNSKIGANGDKSSHGRRCPCLISSSRAFSIGSCSAAVHPAYCGESPQSMSLLG